MAPYESWFSEWGVEAVQQSRQELWRLERVWLATFGIRAKSALEKWPENLGYWEMLSLSDKVLSGATAEEAYSGLAAEPYYVIFERAKTGYACTGPNPPGFAGRMVDVVLFPKDLSWTMAWSHEQDSMGLGPYFQWA